MTKKDNIRKKAPHSASSRHDSEIRLARRAVSAASGGQAQALSASAGPGASANKPTATTAAHTSATATAKSKTPTSAELSPARVGTVMKGLLRAAAGLVTRDARSGPHQAPAVATDQKLADLSCNPLIDLARRHVSLASQFSADSSMRIAAQPDRVLAGLAQAHLRTWMNDSPRPTPSAWPNASGHSDDGKSSI